MNGIKFEEKEMKQLVCEMCGSTDLIKQDGVFVCQNCGTKYSVAEAKKMMIDGTVKVTGSVKVDVSEKVQNLYVLARRAKNEDNVDLAIKYYEMITMEDPNDWEALFYFNYFKAKGTTLGDMNYSLADLKKSLDSVFDLIDKSEKSAEEKWEIAEEIILKINILCHSFISWAKSHYKKFSQLSESKLNLRERSYAIADLQKKMADLLERYFANQSKKERAAYLKSYVKNYLLLDSFDDSDARITLQFHSKELIEAEFRIKVIEPDYKSLVEKVKKEINETSNRIQNDNPSNGTQQKQMIEVNYQMGHVGVNGWMVSPNSAGGVSVRYAIKNVGTKVIKYYRLYFVPYNAVGDIEKCNINKISERSVKGTGPISPNEVENNCIFENAWYNYLITSVKLVKAEIEYMDGTKETIQGDQITSIGKAKVKNTAPVPKSAKVLFIMAIIEPIIILILMWSGLFDSFGDFGIVFFFVLILGVPLLLLAIGRLLYEYESAKSKKDKQNKQQKSMQNKQKRNDTPKENNISKKINTNENKQSKKKVGIICISAVIAIVALIFAFSTFGTKVDSEIVGTWRAERDSSISLTFKNNGDMIVRSANAVDDGLTYKIDGDTVIVTFANDDTETYGFAVEGDTLIFGEYYYTKLK